MKNSFIAVGLLLSSFVCVAGDFVHVREVETSDALKKAVAESKRLGREAGDFGEIDLVQKLELHQASEERLFYVLRGIIDANQSATRDANLLEDILKSKEDSLTHEQMGPYTLLEWCAIQSKFEKDWEENSKWNGRQPSGLNSQCANYLLNKKLVRDAKPNEWLDGHTDSGLDEYDAQTEVILGGLRRELRKGAREVRLKMDPWPSVDGEILILLSKDLKKAFVVRSDLGA